jgi:hypothetical protein
MCKCYALWSMLCHCDLFSQTLKIAVVYQLRGIRTYAVGDVQGTRRLAGVAVRGHQQRHRRLSGGSHQPEQELL